MARSTLIVFLSYREDPPGVFDTRISWEPLFHGVERLASRIEVTQVLLLKREVGESWRPGGIQVEGPLIELLRSLVVTQLKVQDTGVVECTVIFGVPLE